MKERREQLKQKRIMEYFIEATKEIINSEGIRAVTIRKVSNLAGYTSATLYNYFDNLTHLIFLASMCQLEEYNEKLSDCIATCENSIEIYMSICKCYTTHAYEKPEIFELLFFSQRRDKFEEYTTQYYEIYHDKDEKKWPKFLNDMSHTNSLHLRRLSLLNKCVEDGFMKKEDAQDFTNICLRFYKTILQDVKDGVLEKDEALLLTLKYDYKLFGFYINPEHKHLVEEYATKILKGN